MSEILSSPQLLNVNEIISEKAGPVSPIPGPNTPGIMLPSADAFDLGGLAQSLAKREMSDGQKLAIFADELCKTLEPLGKAPLTKPPAVYSYATFETMPDPNSDAGLIPWPGLPPETLAKMAGTLIAPKIVTATRTEDIKTYSQLAQHSWKRGWAIEMLNANKEPSEAILRDIRNAEQFIQNCTIEFDYSQAIKRDSLRYNDFATFLAKIVTDTFTYDGIAIFTDRDSLGRVKGFSALPAGNIRLATERGYKGNPEDYAVLVNNGEQVLRAFTREDLIWSVRNPRTDPTAGNYGQSELDSATMIVKSFEDALELNADRFTKSGIPNGMLIFSGTSFTQRELDLITRMWQNLKKGITKQWALPVMALPPNTTAELMDFSSATNKDALFQEHLNLTIGIYCCICGIPTRRLGFRISGKVPEARDNALGKEAAASAFNEEDNGLIDLLTHIELIINSYILWSRYPHLRFVFRGKTPREDAREYEVRQLAETYAERRAKVDLKPLSKLAPKGMEYLAMVMDMAPCDPGLAGIYQTAASIWLKSHLGGKIDEKDEEKAGPRFPGTQDGAKKESHGRISGTRDSSGAKN